MLSLKQIKGNFSPGVFEKNPKAALVEYLQYEILDSMFKQKGSEKLSFMGGTAIRIVCSSGRFSENLDFNNFGLSFVEFEDVFEKVVKDMSVKGFKLEYRFVEKGAYHCYIKFPGLLSDNNLSEYRSEKILVRIDTALKDEIFKPDIFILNGFGVYQKILVNTLEILLSQKILAFLGRKRTKGRDIYDISFLLARAKPDFIYLEKYLNVKETFDLKKLVLDKLDTLYLPDMTTGVEPFLFSSADKERILSFREYIEQKL